MGQGQLEKEQVLAQSISESPYNNRDFFRRYFLMNITEREKFIYVDVLIEKGIGVQPQYMKEMGKIEKELFSDFFEENLSKEDLVRFRNIYFGPHKEKTEGVENFCRERFGEEKTKKILEKELADWKRFNEELDEIKAGDPNIQTHSSRIEPTKKASKRTNITDPDGSSFGQGKK